MKVDLPIELILAGGESCKIDEGWNPGGIFTSLALTARAVCPFHWNPVLDLTCNKVF